MISLSDAILDSIDVHVVVIDCDGLIQFVNEAWKNFFTENGGKESIDWQGFNYLNICQQAALQGDSDANNIVQGLDNVIASHMDYFEYEYPCHSLTDERWYILRVTPLAQVTNRYLITHQNVTRNKLIEEKATKLSIEDPLTSLYNRRGLDLCFTEEFDRAIRYRTSLSFAILDVDYFKALNDSLGHKIGDQCLIDVANIIRRYTRRPTDIAARIGGDEFVIVFSQMTKDKVLRAVNAIKSDVESLSVSKDLTVSIGVALFMPDSESYSKDDLYERADKALYLAKKHRNHIVIYNHFERALDGIVG